MFNGIQNHTCVEVRSFKILITSIAHRPVAPEASVIIHSNSKGPCDNPPSFGVWPSLSTRYFGIGYRRLSNILLSTSNAASAENQSIENPEHAGSPQDLHGLLNFAQLLLIPAVMKLLATGTHQTNPQAQNPVLNNFLRSNQNGGALLSEAFQLASQLLHK